MLLPAFAPDTLEGRQGLWVRGAGTAMAVKEYRGCPTITVTSNVAVQITTILN
ncbi:MAG: hypothetical protein GQ533_06255 [Methanosarcinaceae archaeon]|nr:hypothetical protein [Methanosarcinaceae archaeon]